MTVAIPVVMTATDSSGQTALSVGGAFTPGTPASSGPSQVGFTSIGPIADSGNANLLIAQPITLAQADVIQSLSFYVRVVGGQLRMGLYTDNNGAPGTKITETNPFTPVAGWNTQATLAQATCPAGNYWIVYLAQSNTLGFFNENNSSGIKHVTFTFGTLPVTFPAPTGADASWFSFYATFQVTIPGTNGVWTAPNPNPMPPPVGFQILLNGQPAGSFIAQMSAYNAGAVVGPLTIVNGTQTTPIVLGGPDAAKFAVTNGGMIPCNLIVGPKDIPDGPVSITLSVT